MTGHVRPIRRGTVTAYDPVVGLGEVRDEGPEGARYGFHCTQIADGSRQIAEGTPVVFTLVATRQGCTEAAQVTATAAG